jgi:hypothetical protein
MTIRLCLIVVLLISAARAEQSVIYVYRARSTPNMLQGITVMCDGMEVAKLENGRFFALALPQGEHVIADRRPQYNLRFRVESGREYYVHARWISRFPFAYVPSFELMAEQQGRPYVQALRPADPSQIRDPRVTLDPPATRADRPNTLANKDILKMVSAGISHEVIVEKIKSSPADYRLETEDLIELKDHGVPDLIVRAMIEASRTAQR